jgi:cytochrome c biogenesis factor
MVAQATNASAALDAAFYNYANFPFVAGLLLAMIGYSFGQKATNKVYLALIGAIAVCSIALGAVSWPTSNVLANLGLPLLTAVLLAALASPLLAVKRHSRPAVSRTLIHLGFVIVLLGVFASSTTQQVTVINDVKMGSTVQASGLTLTLAQCSSCTDNNSIELKQGIFPQSSNLVVDTAVIDSARVYNPQLSVYLYTAYGLISQPTIIRTGLDDIYIHANVTQEVYSALLNSLAGNSSMPETLTITVEKVPMINVVWVGVSLLVVGGVISIASAFRHQKNVKKQR